MLEQFKKQQVSHDSANDLQSRGDTRAVVLRQSYAATCDEIQTRPDGTGYPSGGSGAFSRMADGPYAGDGDNCPLLAGDEP